MWTGGKPPPIPSSPSPPGVSPGKFRPKTQDVELEALRQRGLAKLLNKHFTETTRRLAAEKAAADAALRDLRARKASMSDFQVSNELSGLETLVHKANQWRAECRQQEKETLLLYQRYVDKFGATGNVVAPETPVSAPETPAAESPATLPESPAVSAQLAAPPPSDTPLSDDAASLPGQWPQSESTDAPSILTTPTGWGQQARRRRRRTSNKHHSVSKKGKETDDFREYYRRQQQYPSSEQIEKEGPTTPGTDPELEAFARTINAWAENLVDQEDSDDKEETEEDDVLAPLFLQDDELSVVSGLTSVNSAMTREIMHDCERSVLNFLKEEKLAIRNMIQRQPNVSEDLATMSVASRKTHASSEIGSVQAQMADQAESMAKQMQEILNNFANHSSIAKPTVSPEKRPSRKLKTSNPDENWVVYYDETFQREYFHEQLTNKTQWEPPESSFHHSSTDATSTSSTHYSRATTWSDFQPETAGAEGGSVASVSRIALYRRKQRRQRRQRRKIAVAALVVSAILAAVGYVHYTRPTLIRDTVERVVLGRPATQEAELLKQQQELERRAAFAAAEVAQKEKQAEVERRRVAEEQQRQKQLQLQQLQQQKLELERRQAAAAAKEAQRIREEQEARAAVRDAPKLAAWRPDAMGAYCAHVTTGSALASLC